MFLINPYRFGGPAGGAYAVNGKDPIHAWVPSNDSAGNGTTTLTDLVGSENGTLTNMDAASDWVANTGAGGVRALDFNETNSYVELAPLSTISTVKSVSIWAYVRDNTKDNDILSTGTHTGGVPFLLWYDFAATNGWRVLLTGNTSGSMSTDIGVATLNSWEHLVVSIDSTEVRFWLNGVEPGNSPFSITIAGGIGTTGTWELGNAHNSVSKELDGLIDDCRFFDQVLSDSDVAYLYNSGSGRGRTS